MKAVGGTDPQTVVVDEAAGQCIALLPAALNPWAFAAGFVLFRLFDIVKPWPIRLAERRIPGALGVMVDDVLAGLYAAALIGLYRLFGDLG